MTTLANKLRISQQSIDTAPHLVVEALAGTGKTTTLVDGIKPLYGEKPKITPSPQQRAVWDALMLSKFSDAAPKVCFVAFNKSIATELQRRVPKGCAAMTMHSMGLKAVTAAFGRVQVEADRVFNLISDILGEEDIRRLRRDNFELLTATQKLVGLCKMNLTDQVVKAQLLEGADEIECWAEQLENIADHYEIELNGNAERVFDLVPKVLERCRDVNTDRQIDFNDMIWLPVSLGLPVMRYNLLLVDESQDLNRCQQSLARSAGDRLALCGDCRQAIYGFAGADAQSMQRMKAELSATPRGCLVLPLTVTRRCGKKIVAEAQRIVPAFEAHESNPEGQVSHAAYNGELVDETEVSEVPHVGYANLVQDGDMLLCRVNAPLVSQCFRFIKAGRRAEIQGRDIGQGLISTVKKLSKGYSGPHPVAKLVGRLSDWLSAETRKENKKRNPSEARLIALQDKHDCILCFTEGADTIEEVISRIERVFTDNSDVVGIRLSTIHKAKGLEANRVFLLEPEGATVPHPMAKSDWQREQEMNLRYVAITRAIRELVYVR